ncbi:hypothetical protein ACH419_32225 [Streptomyces bobili]|uniref:hypothetical protein n=1 Tax=Streptomyces bobili TaxID=67280 RepID=UPI0037915F5F
MSALAASPAMVDAPVIPRQRSALRSVPTQAGPVPERGPAPPLALGRDTQARFRGAVRALLDAPSLEDASDAVRLAVIVLASRTPSETGVVEIRTPELGRWLGLSASYVASDVVPALRRSGLVSIDTAEGEFGQDIGLACRVLPVWAAYGVVGHPLALEKKEFATLLRLLEAVMAPGWAHKDGKVTPAGLLGSRVGRAAATDRLALLLLVLEAREDGRVRQCGGTVDTKRGRAAATVARLLGCKASRGERVLERLEDRDLVQRVRVGTVSGLAHRTRLIVPAVASAHGKRGASDTRREDRATAPNLDFLEPDVAAGDSETFDPDAELQVSSMPVANEAGVTVPDVTAALHTDHSLVGTDVSSLALSGGFSGEGRGGEDGRPERVCVREDQAADGETAVAESAPQVAEGGPLRGEKPKESPVDERGRQRASGAVASGRPKAGGWERTQQRRVGLPADLGLRVALEPVSRLWGRLSGWQQDQVEAAAKAEVKRLAGLLEQPEMAARLLADRLTDRLEETGGEALVDRPYPWLIRRGLVQRPACSDPRCDDGIRLDTGSECQSCGNVIHIRLARRARIATEIDRELPDLDGHGRRQVLEERLREHTRRDAEQTDARRAQAVAEVEMRRAAVAGRRAAEETAALERLSAACVDCGLPGAAGLCPECTFRRRTDVLVQQAVDLAVAVRADLDDPAQIAALSERCEADTRSLVAEVCRRQADKSLAAFTAQEVAKRIRDERRASAHRRLLRSEEAGAEAEAVYETVLRRRPRGHQAAQQAANDARQRTARYLLECMLGQLQTQRTRMKAGRTPK